MSLLTDYTIPTIQAGQSQEYLSANTAMQRLLDLIANPTDVAVTAGNVALTAAQARYGLINATSVGDPGANREISVPSGLEGIWIARNAIGSSRTMTFKVAGGTGVTVPDGESRLCFSRGGTAIETIAVTVSGYATEAYVDTAIAALIDSSPSALDTLNELAAALADDANFASTMTTALAGKVDTTDPRLSDDRDPNDHTHSAAGSGGPLEDVEWNTRVGNPSAPAAGKLTVFAKDDGTGTVRLYAINEDSDLFDLTSVITSFLGLSDVPNAYTGKAGMRVLVKGDESGVDFYNGLQASKTANYTLTDGDEEILANATGGAFTITLPTAVGRGGKQYLVKKTDSSDNIVTVTTTSSQTIDGRTGRKLATQYSYTRVISDGANWIEVAAETPGMVPLTDGANIAVDCLVFPLRGGKAKVTLGGNRTLDAATGMANGMVLWVQWKQDATGSRTITHNAAYIGSTDVPLPTLSTAANTVDEVAYKYDATAAKWRTMAVNKGFAS